MNISRILFTSALIALAAMIAVSTGSCGKKQQLQKLQDPYSQNLSDSDEIDEAKIAYELPFVTTEHGSHIVDVSLNGVPLKFMWDTGCSITMISSLELANLQKAGAISTDDLKGMGSFSFADGSTKEQPVFNIDKLELVCRDGKRLVLTDVLVNVTDDPNADALLGTNVFNRLPKHAFNLETGFIEFEEP